MSIPLLPGEELIVTSENGAVTLTNKRLLITGNASFSSVYLEDISSIQVSYYGDVYYLAVVMVLVFSIEQFALNIEDRMVFLAIQFASCVAVAFVWWLFRRAVISVNTKARKEFLIPVNKKGFSKIPDFIDRIHVEKNRRIEQLSNAPK